MLDAGCLEYLTFNIKEVIMNSIVEGWWTLNQSKLDESSKECLHKTLSTLTEDQAKVLSSVKIKNPVFFLIITLFFGALGIQRFLLKDWVVGGVILVATIIFPPLGGILALIDLFRIMGLVRKSNSAAVDNVLTSFGSSSINLPSENPATTVAGVADKSPINYPPNYYIRFKYWPLSLDGKFHICDNAGNMIAFFRLKALKLKSEIHVFKEKQMLTKLLHIKARNAVAFSAAYEVTNPITEKMYGIWKRNGAMSLLMENWFLYPPDNENMIIGRIEEDSAGMAFLRRYKMTSFIVNVFCPKSYRVLGQDGSVLATFRRSRNPIIPKLYVKRMPSLDGDMGELVAAGAIILVSAGNTAFSATQGTIKVG